MTKRQQDIMQILWNAKKPLVASQFLEYDPTLNINTVHQALRTLLKNGFIKVDDIVYSGTVLTRCYVPVISADDYVRENYLDLMGTDLSSEIICNYIDQITNVDTLNEIAEHLDQRLKSL